MKRCAAAAALLLAGSAFFLTGMTKTVRRDVVISGVEVGGMPCEAAERAVREAIAPQKIPFALDTPCGRLLPAVVYTDNVSALVRSAGRGMRAEARVRRFWPDAEEFIERACRMNTCAPVDADVRFSRGGFLYVPERFGTSCDYARSLQTALAAFARGEEHAALVTRPWAPAVTVRDLKARTHKLASFTTRFDASKRARVHNIALSCERVAGTTLGPGERFSFNATVGERTEANGFLEATVIYDGRFTAGVGGGVCQTSTTLMGAAIAAGLTIAESHPHSLSVGYVAPSLDAMVSKYSDLQFVNPYPFPVYLTGETSGGTATFTVYGQPDGRRYVAESRVLSRLPPPAAPALEGKEARVVRAPKDGMVSESYVAVYDAEGKLLSRRRLRRDRYAPVRGIYEAPPSDAPAPSPPEGDQPSSAARGG